MRYEDSVIEEVREANDIVDVIGQHVRLTKKGANYFGLCPFHGEKTASFSVSPRKQIYYCFGCGAGGNVISFLMQYENYSFTEALKALADRANITLPEAKESEADHKSSELRKNLLEINKEAAVYYYNVLHSPEGAPGIQYFSGKRKLSPQTLTHFGLGFSPKASDALYRYLKSRDYSDDLIKASGLVIYSETSVRDRFWNRVIFPIMDTNNRVIGFGGRVLGDALPKYLNSPETPIFDKSSNLYGLNFAKKAKQKYLLLCEGYMDVIALHQAGFTNAVASLGTAFNEKHARLLKRYTDQVILTQDSDTAGINAKLKAFPILYEAGLQVKVLEMSGAKDPDEFIKLNGPSAYEECIRNSKNAFLWMIGILKTQYDLSDPAERTAFYNASADRLCMFRETMERDNYIDSVSSQFMIDHDELKRMVDRRFENKGTTAAREIFPPETKIRVMKEPAEKPEMQEAKYEKLLISWMCERPELVHCVLRYVDADSIGDEVYREILKELLRNGKIDEARFLSAYSDDEEKRTKAAAVFSAENRNDSLESFTQNDIEKGLTEAVRAIRLSAVSRAIEECGSDIMKLNALLKEKNELKKLRVEITE